MKSEDAIYIGIFQGKNDNDVLEIISRLLEEYDYGPLSINKPEGRAHFNKDCQEINLVLINSEMLASLKTKNYRFDVLIHNFSGCHSPQKGLMTGQLASEFKNCRYLILNSDDESWLDLPLNSFDGMLITYGFNSKATLTISSYDTNENIRASICLQRELISMEGEKIEPQELSIEIHCADKNYIYPVLVASALILILGYKCSHIVL